MGYLLWFKGGQSVGRFLFGQLDAVFAQGAAVGGVLQAPAAFGLLPFKIGLALGGGAPPVHRVPEGSAEEQHAHHGQLQLLGQEGRPKQKRQP